MTKSERRGTLLEGRARFEIVRESRPFVVEVGSGAVRTAEGVLDVGVRNHDEVEVALVSGQAEVRRGSSDDGVHALVADRPVRYFASHPILVTDDGVNRREWPSDRKSTRLNSSH